MKKFTKEDLLELSALSDLLKEGNRAVEDAKEAFVNKLCLLYAEYNEAIDKHNAYIEQFNEYVEGRIEDIDIYIDEKSERWKESDICNRYETWKSQLEDAHIPELEKEIRPDIEFEPVEVADDFPISLPDED